MCPVVTVGSESDERPSDACRRRLGRCSSVCVGVRRRGLKRVIGIAVSLLLVYVFELAERLWWRLSARFAWANASLGCWAATGLYLKNSSDPSAIGFFFLRIKNIQMKMRPASATVPPIAPPTITPKWEVVEEEEAVPVVWVGDGVLVAVAVVEVLVELAVSEGVDARKTKDALGDSVANAP